PPPTYPLSLHDALPIFHRPADEHVVRDVVPVELEPGVVAQVLDVGQGPGDQVVHADHLVPLSEEPLAQVRPDEPRPAGDECTHEDRKSTRLNSSHLVIS